MFLRASCGLVTRFLTSIIRTSSTSRSSPPNCKALDRPVDLSSPSPTFSCSCSACRGVPSAVEDSSSSSRTRHTSESWDEPTMAKLMNGLGLNEQHQSPNDFAVNHYNHNQEKHFFAGENHGDSSAESGVFSSSDGSRSPVSEAEPKVNGSCGILQPFNGYVDKEYKVKESIGKWKPFLIGVAGGTASGKTSVCHRIMCKLGQHDLKHDQRRVVTISSDSFYRVLNADERERARLGEFNFDHPDALDYELILKTMKTILTGKRADIPVYDFVTHSRLPNEYIQVYPADVVLFEGILVFYFPELRNLFQLKLFVDMDADTRLARRVVRDLKDRGRDLPSVIHQYTLFVKPAFEEFCQPTKKYADVIIPRGAENEVAINLIVQHISEHLLPLASENGSPRRSSQEDVPTVKSRQNGGSPAEYENCEKLKGVNIEELLFKKLHGQV